MSKLKYGEALALRNALRDDLSIMIPEWELAAQYVAPHRFRSMNPDGRPKGARMDRHIIKNQAGRSLRTFFSGMHNGATPRARPWFNLTVNNSSKRNATASRRYFSTSEEVINSHFQISNLYRVLPMTYKDLGVFSNSAFAMLPDARYGFWFYPFAIGTYSFSCNSKGDTDVFTRDFAYTVRELVNTYGKLKPNGHIDWSNIPNWVKGHWDGARYMERIVLSQLICPNKDYGPTPSLDPSERKFQSYTFVQSMGSGMPPQTSSGFRNENQVGNQSEFLKVSGFDYFPVITPRWEVQAEESFGIDGPTQLALSDILTLQAMEKGRLTAIDKLLRPPMVGHASLRRHQASILPGGITYVDDQGALAGFKPAFAMDPRIAELVADQSEYTAAIRDAYFESLFMMLSGEDTVSHVTAAEIRAKESEKLAILTPVLGQLDQDLNSKLIFNAQHILEDMGRMPKRPKELEGEQLRPEYISVLAQAAKASMMASTERMMNFVVSVANAQQDPSLLKLMPGDRVIRLYGDYVGVNPTLLLDEDEFSEVRAGIAQAQEAQAQAVNQAQEAETAKTLSQAKTQDGSMLDNVLGFTG